MKKRGELTSFQLALLIFAIMGLIVGILFFISIRNTNYSSDQICKLSVLSRATLEKAVTSAGSVVPLQCTTKKICIVTSNSGSCDQFKGEPTNEVTKVVLPNDRTEAIHLIEEKSAEAMYSCWESMGEGKLDVFNNVEKATGFSSAQPTCVICSRIAIGKDVRQDLIDNVNVNRYLANNYVPGTSIKYIQAFSDQAGNTITKIDQNVLDRPNTKDLPALKVDKTLQGLNDIYGNNVEYLKDNSGGFVLDGNGKRIQVNREMVYVFMQIKSQGIGETWKNQLAIGTTIAGGAFVTSQAPVVGAVTRFVWSLIPTGAKVYGTLVAATVVGGYGAYNAVQGQQVAAGYCGDLVSKESDNNKGCSIVQGVNYNVADINSLCITIQGNP